MSKYTIVGFDPASTRNIGWSSFSLSKKPSNTAKISKWSGGTFVMPITEEKWQVLWPMFESVNEFLEEQQPHLVVVEKTSSFAGGFITGQVSHCMGVILAVCGKLSIPVEFVYPTSVKKLVAGHGRAPKGKVKKATKNLLIAAGIEDVKFHSDHTADAAASVFYWLIKAGVISPEEEKEE
jgi:Holliday junction resolvasome RuvABC endonuclease subunit